MLRPRQVILLPAVIVGRPMSMGGQVVQFRRPLMVLVMRSVVIACGHRLKAHDLAGFGMSFLGEFISALRVLLRPFGMPVPALVIAFLVVLRGRAVGMC